jgi:polyisoprenoid-binding protein YceI
MTATTETPTLATGTWIADPVHSDVSFRVRHMGVGRVRGTFALGSAELTVGDDPQVTAVIDATSVQTGNEDRDQHVRSADFLDVERHPTIGFTSTEVRDFADHAFTLVGELTVHGVTRAIELRAEFLGVVADPAGGQRTGFAATTTISRAAFGVDIQLGFGAGNVAVADSIEIAIDIEFVSGQDAR